MAKRRKSEDSSEGESSDEQANNVTTSKTPANVADDSSSSSDDGDHEWTSSGAKKGKKKKKNKSGKALTSNKKMKSSPHGEDDEREEGEVEDDDDDDKSEDDFADEFNDGYDENLMGDEADQERLAKMTEKEREEELFNRSEKREMLRARFEIERKLRMQRKAEKSSSSGPTSVGASTTKTNVRRRNLEDKNSRSASLRHLKEQRDKKKQKQTQKLRTVDVYSSSSSDDDDDDDVTTGPSYQGPVGANRTKSSSSSSSDSSSEDSDGDVVRHRSSNKSSRRHSDDFSNDEKDDYVISLADLNSIRVTRSQMEAWCHTPFFSKTIKDAFVKMGIGAKNAKPIYRICQILDVYEGPDTYTLNKTRTNKMIKVRYGKSEKSFRLEYISNGDFVANEFTEWKEKLEAEKLDLPKKSMITSKQADLATAANYQFTESEIEFMVKEKAKFNKNPSNYAMKKTQLLKEKELAEQMNDYIAVERIQKELNELEERAKELDKQRTHTIAAISFINERNRLKNIKEAEKAILAEAEKERASGNDDPFRRRKCAPTLFTLKNQKNQLQDEGNGTNGSSDAVDGANSQHNNFSNDTKSNLLNSSKDKGNSSPNRVDDGDLFNAHNFDIQLDFDIPTSTLPPTAPVNSTNGSTSLNVSSSSNSRRSLNLEEYKKKKGLI